MSNDIEPVAVFGKGVTRGRYVEASDGDILDTLGGYYISRQFWDQRLAEGRSDTARHDFRHLPVPPRSMGQGYFLDLVRCERCGEEREDSTVRQRFQLSRNAGA